MQKKFNFSVDSENNILKINKIQKMNGIDFNNNRTIPLDEAIAISKFIKQWENNKNTNQA